MQEYRLQDVKLKLGLMGSYPLDVLVVGCTGAGKSTTLNALFEKEVARVGMGVDPETMELDSYKLNPYIRLWDSPGLGDGKEKDVEHSQKIKDLLNQCCKDKKYGFVDLVLVLVEGSKKDLGTTYGLLNEVIIPNFPKDRILVAINQCDMAMKGRNWKEGEPNVELLQFLQDQAQSVQDRVFEATGVKIIRPIFYSALHRYNLHALYDFIINHIPRQKRKMG